MKKIITLLALALATATAANAQLGVVGGFTSSNTSINAQNFLENAKNVSQYHVGIAYRMEMANILVLQPALTYEAKGANLQEVIASGSASTAFTGLDTRTGFVELSVGAQLGIDLLAFRPYVLVQPFVGYQVTGSEKYQAVGVTSETMSKYLADAKNKLEYGFGIGGGVELLQHLQISLQWFMNLGKLYDNGKLDASAVESAVLSNYKDVKNYQGLKLSLALFF